MPELNVIQLFFNYSIISGPLWNALKNLVRIREKKFHIITTDSKQRTPKATLTDSDKWRL